jgi:predicted  nucleic acid-binding Zn-ribbon protein
MMKQILIITCTTALVFSLALTGCNNGAKQKAELERLKAELESLRAALEKTESERDNLKARMDIVAQTRDQLQKQVNELTSSRKQFQEQLNELTGLRDRVQEQLAELISSRDQLQEQLTKLADSRDQLRKQVDELTKSRDAAVTEAQKAQEQIDKLVTQLQAETDKVRQLQDQPISTNQTQESGQTRMVEVIELPTIHSFDTARPQIKGKQSSTLSWQVSNADRIRIEPGIGSVSTLGSRIVKPSKSTTYTLIATNKAGESRQTRWIEVI